MKTLALLPLIAGAFGCISTRVPPERDREFTPAALELLASVRVVPASYSAEKRKLDRYGASEATALTGRLEVSSFSLGKMNPFPNWTLFTLGIIPTTSMVKSRLILRYTDPYGAEIGSCTIDYKSQTKWGWVALLYALGDEWEWAPPYVDTWVEFGFEDRAFATAVDRIARGEELDDPLSDQ